MQSKPQLLPRRITRSQAVGTYRSSVNKGKEVLHVDLAINDDSSDDDSSEDSSFKPIQGDSFSSEDNTSMSKPRNKKLKDSKRGASAIAKTKEKIIQPDDALVKDVSDGEVDLGFVGTTGIVDVYKALDPGTESDGANTWHSKEMKTPPNSEDELQSDEDSNEFPIFRNCVKEYVWVVYASRDCDDSCWQIKTFNDDHTCARENANKAANRALMASKLVKKVRKYPNFKQCEAAVYFRTKCDLMLNRNFITRTLADARNVVYRDEKGAPQSPNIRRRPGALTKKRRKDANEGNSGNKKAKPSGSLKRHLKSFTCRYCGVKGHTKRGCSKKRLDEVATVVAAAKAATYKVISNATASASRTDPQPTTAAAPTDNPPTAAPIDNPHAAATVDNLLAMEIELSQPNCEGSQDIAGAAASAPSTPEKLLTKRRSSPPPQSIGVDPMQGASVATSSRLASFYKWGMLHIHVTKLDQHQKNLMPLNKT
ncbi:hypothetical protein Ahy_B03g066343 [Arachis hypogaea]|uniref:CCHC-type domain-containing protein n=1 Tax=Arachis hypogaea TaxID=3818 RepID=A0A445A3U3_ARAHY|nr:hypothetical protein Ahy_B03g066343 [Arachis hypogaea]